jgi:hypothetical protein
VPFFDERFFHGQSQGLRSDEMRGTFDCMLRDGDTCSWPSKNKHAINHSEDQFSMRLSASRRETSNTMCAPEKETVHVIDIQGKAD